MGKQFILFDFDGVILDSYQIAYETQKTLCPYLTEDQYRAFFEGNIFETVYVGNIRHCNECRHDEDYYAHYIPKLKRDGVRLVPDMDTAVRLLAKTHTLIIVSSGDDNFIEEFLAGSGVTSHFTGIMGNNVHKSKEEKIKMIFATYSINASQCVFITDTLGDIREAAKVDAGAIGVTWGFHESERLAKGSPFWLVDTPELLPTAIADYFALVE